MKKYEYRSLPAAPSGRRRKPRTSSSFPFKLIVLFLCFCAASFALCVGATRAYRALTASRIGVWKPTEISLSGAEGALAKEIQQQAKSKLDTAFSAADAAELQRSISQRYPQLCKVQVRRGLLSGKLKIAVKKRRPVAKFTLPGGAVRYIDGDSTIYTDPQPDPLLQVPFVELEGQVPQQLGAEFVDLVQSTFKLKERLDFAFLRFNPQADTVRLQLPDGSIVNFGKAKNLSRKARRAAQIENIASARGLPVPHELDFTYFDDGKVFLRQMPH